MSDYDMMEMIEKAEMREQELRKQISLLAAAVVAAGEVIDGDEYNWPFQHKEAITLAKEIVGG